MRKKETKYQIKDLYVGVLGYVTKVETNNIWDTVLRSEANEYNPDIIIYKKETYTSKEHSLDKEEVAINVFTNKMYYLFGNIQNYSYRTVYKVINNYAVCQSIPLEKFFSKPIKTITEEELLSVYDYLNNKYFKKTPKNKEQITDSILKTILETIDLVKAIDADEETIFLKESTIKELEELATTYTNRIKEIKETKEPDSNQEYLVRIDTIKKLSSITYRLRPLKRHKVHSLKKEHH